MPLSELVTEMSNIVRVPFRRAQQSIIKSEADLLVELENRISSNSSYQNLDSACELLNRFPATR